MEAKPTTTHPPDILGEELPADSYSLVQVLGKLFPPVALPTPANLTTEEARLAYMELLGQRCVIDFLEERFPPIPQEGE